MTKLLRTLWRISFEPVYRRLFRRYFEATLRRLDSLHAELHNHIAGINERQGAVNAEVIRRLDELDRHVRIVVAARWDEAAMTRRIAALEERLERNGKQLEEPPA